MKKIELEQWEPFPGDPRRMQYAGQRVAQEVFEELKHRLEDVYKRQLLPLIPWSDKSSNICVAVATKSIVSIVLLLYLWWQAVLPALSLYRFGGRFCYSDVFVESPGFMGLDAATSE